MPRGPYHSRQTPDGKMFREDGEPDGRQKLLGRDTPYYTRLNLAWFIALERLLDTPTNQAAGTSIRGCVSRAALIEKVFAIFFRIDAVTREHNYGDVDDLVRHLFEAFDFVQRQGGGVSGVLSAPAHRPALPPPTASLGD